jgi:hypothetical protein
MAEDVTSLLIQRITTQLSEGQQIQVQQSESIIGSLTTGISFAADYAQLLSTAVGPLTQADTAAMLGAALNVALLGGDSKAITDAAAAAPGAAVLSSGAGAAVVLVVAAVMAIVTVAWAASGPDETDELLQALIQLGLEDLDAALVGEWNSALAPFWTFYQQLWTDINFLAEEGIGLTTSPQVAGPPPQMNKFIYDAANLAGLFVNDGMLWQRPFISGLLFIPGTLPSPIVDGITVGWYGQLPLPQVSGATPADSPLMQDPRTLLPVMLWAIHSYLAIGQVAKQVDPSQYTFPDFLTNLGGQFSLYAEVIYGQLTSAFGAVNPDPSQPLAGPVQPPPGPAGLVKTDVPQFADVLDGVGAMGVGVAEPVLIHSAGDPPRAGNPWNGVYGVVDAFAPYLEFVQVPLSTPSCIIDVLPADVSIGQLQFTSDRAVQRLAYAWVRNKVVLGLMARWKALYLLHHYDQVWRCVQQLRRLTGQSPYPVLQLPDGTQATGDWSVREISSILLTTVPYGFPDPAQLDGSLYGIVQAFDELANGDWTGPAIDEFARSEPARPVSFRDRLAAALGL